MRRRLLLTLAFVLLWAPLAAPAAGQSPVVHRIAVTGTVEKGLAPYVARSLREAEAAGAAAAYLDIDTPGGRVDAAERISDAIRRSAVPVYAFVNPRAFSAGALIAISAREVYMRPGWVMGAATPVDGEGHVRPRKWCRRCGPSSGRSRRSAASTRGSPRRWWTRRSRFRGSIARASCSP